MPNSDLSDALAYAAQMLRSLPSEDAQVFDNRQYNAPYTHPVDEVVVSRMRLTDEDFARIRAQMAVEAVVENHERG